jgi:SAM-dependent methyltransferase
MGQYSIWFCSPALMNDPSSQLGAIDCKACADSREFDGMASSYDALLQDPLRDRFVSRPDFFHRRKWSLIQSFLEFARLDPGQMDWLDVGCGRGDLLNLAANHFRLAEGCEPSQEMIRHGQGRIHWQPELNKLPFESSTYDFITTVCVFHHVPLPSRPALVCEAMRLLRPGGTFCVIEHNPWNPVTRWIVSRSPVDQDAHLLSARTTAGLARSAGFEAVDTRYFLYAPEKWYQRVGWLEDLFKDVPAGGQYAVFARKPAANGSGVLQP